MSSFSSLEVGKKALAAQRLGLDVTSNNIANVNTPNYSRRQAIFSESDPRVFTGGFNGTGVLLDNLRNFREELFDKEIRNTLSRKTGYEYDEKIAFNIESILNEPSDNGINELTTKFFNAFQDLANTPENVSKRSYLLEQAKTLVERFHSTAEQMEDARYQIMNDTLQNVTKINSLLKDIASLNENIAATKVQATQDVQTYIDSREEKLEELSKVIGINVTKGDFGMVNVYVNGINLITGVDNTEVKIQDSVNPTSGERTLQLVNVDSQGNLLNYLKPGSGEITNQMKHFNVTLDNLDSSGGFSAYKKLDEFADAIVQKVNGFTVTGYGLDDLSGPPPARNFFSPAVGSASALNIEISSDILNAPRKIPLSDSANEPGNSKIAQSIANIAVDGTFLDNMTPAEFYADFLGRVGSMGSEATTGKSSSQIVNDQLMNQRESVIGVSLDEEAINLIKFQKAFEASSRIINTMNEFLTTIINLGK